MGLEALLSNLWAQGSPPLSGAAGHILPPPAASAQHGSGERTSKNGSATSFCPSPPPGFP